MVREKPETAFVFSLIGGIFILVDGTLGLLFSVRYQHWPMWIWEFQWSEYVLGIVGILLGTIVIISAVMAYKRGRKLIHWGVIIIVASFISLIAILGGYVVGFVFGLVGGLLLVVWEPSEKKLCVRCGREIRLDSVFCPYCGMSYAPGFYTYPPQYPPSAQQMGQHPSPPGSQAHRPEQSAGKADMCPKCGIKLLEGATFCASCGARVR